MAPMTPSVQGDAALRAGDPRTGGDTLFANGYAAYDAMPERLKQRLEGAIGAFTYGGRRKTQALLNAEDRDWQPVLHPIIRTHPETGRKSLYFDPGKIVVDRGRPSRGKRRSDRRAGRLHDPAGRRYRHKWRVGDIVIWDNRCSYHRRRATIHRTRIASTGGCRSRSRSGQTRRRITTPRSPLPSRAGGRGRGLIAPLSPLQGSCTPPRCRPDRSRTTGSCSAAAARARHI